MAWLKIMALWHRRSNQRQQQWLVAESSI